MLIIAPTGVLELDTSSFELEMPSESTFGATDAWSIRDRKERIKLYKYWLHRYRKYEVEAYLEELCADYEKLCSEKKVLDEELQVQVLNEAAVIGMTTTGVAKFQRLIHAVQPEIVIVEEAAEVLEAHIVTALSAATKHVILIGDHQQLRPGTCKSNYFLLWTCSAECLMSFVYASRVYVSRKVPLWCVFIRAHGLERNGAHDIAATTPYETCHLELVGADLSKLIQSSWRWEVP